MKRNSEIESIGNLLLTAKKTLKEITKRVFSGMGFLSFTWLLEASLVNATASGEHKTSHQSL
jgi:hypothetical protein